MEFIIGDDMKTNYYQLAKIMMQITRTEEEMFQTVLAKD